MSEPRKNHLAIDGAQVKDDEHIATYKPIPESDTEPRPKSSLTKSKEKLSSEEAEKLLEKEDEAKIVTRVDMADAKYVVGDHRNGDAKIELDANKRQFAGLTKEELMKYADDPFWVRLRWTMFVLFWLLWLSMLAGAIAIIIRAPKCYAPKPKTWYETGPLIEGSPLPIDDVSASLNKMQHSGVQGVFVQAPAYEVLDEDGDTAMASVKALIGKAKEFGVNVIVDLTASFVPTSHRWFQLSENRSAEYDSYFIWAKAKGFDETGKPLPPNNWVSKANTPAWVFSTKRNESYLQLEGTLPNLNLSNPNVLEKFDAVLKKWMEAGAGGVRLHSARHLLVSPTLEDAVPAGGRGSDPAADHTQYAFWRHAATTDVNTEPLLTRWKAVVAAASVVGDPVFTTYEDGSAPEYFLLGHNVTSLSPAAAAAVDADRLPSIVAAELRARVDKHWPLLQLKSAAAEEIATFAILLPAAPLFTLDQLGRDNDTAWWWSSVRSEPSVCHGRRVLQPVPAAHDHKELLLLARWKAGHTGYAAIWNQFPVTLAANLTSAPSIPSTLSLHHVSNAVQLATNYTTNQVLDAASVLVPPRSTLLLSYVPETSAEK